MLAAAVWVGALAGLLVLLRRAYNRNGNRGERTTLAKRALTGFSNVGSMAVATIILTGLINSWVLGGLANVPSLGNSLYGRLLLLKLILFAAMLGLAALNRFRLTPAIGKSIKGDDALPTIRAITRSVVFESTVAVTILALVAWQGTLPPPAAAG